MPSEKNAVKFEQPSQFLVLANRFVWLIIILIVLAVLAWGYFFVLAPNIDDIRGQRTATEESDFIKFKHQELLLRLKELRTEYNNIKTTRTDILGKLKAAIPSDPQSAELFVLADNWAQARGFALTDIEIVSGPSEARDGQSGVSSSAESLPQGGLPPAISSIIGGSSRSSSASLALATSSLPLHSLIIHLSLVKEVAAAPPSSAETASPYEAFKRYLSDLETNLRLMDIQSVAFGEFVPDKPVTFNISLVTYYK